MPPTFSGHIRTYSIIFTHIRTYSDIFEPCSNIFGHIRTISGHTRTIFGHIRTYSDIFGHIRTIFEPYSGSCAWPMGQAHGPGPWAGPGPGAGRAQAKHDLLAYDINKKDAQRPYDPFAGGIAPRSLLCVRKRRISFSLNVTSNHGS